MMFAATAELSLRAEHPLCVLYRTETYVGRMFGANVRVLDYAQVKPAFCRRVAPHPDGVFFIATAQIGMRAEYPLRIVSHRFVCG